LAALSVTYKPTLPIIFNMRLSVFVSSSVYYTPAFATSFRIDYSNFQTLNSGLNHGIVYSSDISLNSCYKMQSTPATGPFTLSTLSITYIASSIYGPSIITFNDDTAAYTTVDLIQSAFTKIDSWCPRSTPIYSSLSSS
jgi:hypothetical protein